MILLCRKPIFSLYSFKFNPSLLLITDSSSYSRWCDKLHNQDRFSCYDLTQLNNQNAVLVGWSRKMNVTLGIQFHSRSSFIYTADLSMGLHIRLFCIPPFNTCNYQSHIHDLMTTSNSLLRNTAMGSAAEEVFARRGEQYYSLNRDSKESDR